ncbi:hypothetical protein [Scytonema sp. PCC 10023]
MNERLGKEESEAIGQGTLSKGRSLLRSGRFAASPNKYLLVSVESDT